MILSDVDIRRARRRGAITIDPVFPGAIQPSSVDLHLGRHFKIFRRTSHTCIDLREPIDDLMEDICISGNRAFTLGVGEFALGMTYETVGVDRWHVGILDGKSSLGRVGLLVHVTAGYLDPGNTLKMTLELFNTTNLPIKLYHRMPIAQMRFQRMISEASKGYGEKSLGSKYYRAMRPQASQYHRNFLVNNGWMTFRDRRKKKIA